MALAVEKARYECDRRYRQYEAVEPENRLVATTLEQRWEEALKNGRLELSPMAALMFSDIGQLNALVHIWPYPNMAERARVRAEALRLGIWPPKTHDFMISQQNKIMFPTSFSPMA